MASPRPCPSCRPALAITGGSPAPALAITGGTPALAITGGVLARLLGIA